MPFPSLITSFSYPTPSNRLNNPSHSTLENLQSSTIGQIETIIGLSGDSSTLGTIIGDLRSPDSPGGGHVQTAVKGGTGQTTYTKGDMLVATSPSVLSKLSVGLDGQALVYNSSLAAGIGPATPGGTKISNSASLISLQNISTETSIISAQVIGSTLGVTGALRATVFINDTQNQNTGTDTMLIKANYGSNTLASVLVQFSTSNTPSQGTVQYTLIENGSNAQRGVLQVNIAHQATVMDSNKAGSVIGTFNTGTSSINSSANNNIGLTFKNSSANAAVGVSILGYIVEKIV